MDSTLLTRALDAADARKQAVLGDTEVPAVHVTSEELQHRALWSGFDVDYGEISAVATRAGLFFWRLSEQVPLPPLLSSAWADGLMIGLFVAQLRDRDTAGEG